MPRTPRFSQATTILPLLVTDRRPQLIIVVDKSLVCAETLQSLCDKLRNVLIGFAFASFTVVIVIGKVRLTISIGRAIEAAAIPYRSRCRRSTDTWLIIASFPRAREGVIEIVRCRRCRCARCLWQSAIQAGVSSTITSCSEGRCITYPVSWIIFAIKPVQPH